MKRTRWFAILLCFLGAVFYCYEYYLRISLGFMRPEIMLTYNISAAGFGILASAYFWAYTPLQLPVGILLDRFGVRNILTGACLLCSLGTYFLLTSSSFLLAILGRFFMGVGSAFAYVGVLKLAHYWLPRKYFALMAGLCTALAMLGGLTGGRILSYCIANFGWQKTLYDAFLLGIVLTIILFLCLRDNKQLKKSTNYKKFWQELVIIVKIPTIIKAGLISCFMWLPLDFFANLWAIPFIEQLGFTRMQTAKILSLVSLGYLLGAPSWGFLSYRLKSRKIPLFIGALTSSMTALMIMNINLTLNSLCILLFLLGLMASAKSVVFAIGNDVCSSHLVATTTAYINFLTMLGLNIFIPITGALITNYTMRLDTILLLLPIALFGAFILTLFLPETYVE